MNLRRPAKRHAPETIVALIDVVFFLLVFFMLVGRMDATAPFAVETPVAERGGDLPGGGSTVTVGIDGALGLDGTAMEEDALLARLLPGIEAEPGRLVRINAHRDGRLGTVLPLVGKLEAAGATNVVFVVTPNDPS